MRTGEAVVHGEGGGTVCGINKDFFAVGDVIETIRGERGDAVDDGEVVGC